MGKYNNPDHGIQILPKGFYKQLKYLSPLSQRIVTIFSAYPSSINLSATKKLAAAETGKMYDTTTVRVKPVQTPLSTDGSAAEGYLDNQKDIKELFTKFSFDEMKDSLQKYLAPSEENDTVEVTPPTKEKVDINSKIDDLFG